MTYDPKCQCCGGGLHGFGEECPANHRTAAECAEKDLVTTDRSEAAEDDDGEPIHALSCACVRCTGGRHAEAPLYIEGERCEH